jgi:sugar/nucleoside kinase (ribokinase family)
MARNLTHPVGSRFHFTARQGQPATKTLSGILCFCYTIPTTMSQAQQIAQQAAAVLDAAAPTVPLLKAVIGLDGFVDSIIAVVDKRESAEKFKRLATLAGFGERIARAAGMSTQAELVVERVKLGGNGPIMANALAAAGLKVTSIGNLGYPAVHPAFAELSQRATIISIAEAAYTDALEFEDGKLMLGKRESLKDVTWENLVARVGQERLLTLFRESSLIGLQNWTMLPHMSDIYQHVLSDICPQLTGSPRRCFFFDLADPEMRAANDVCHAVELIAQFQEYFDTTLGLNEKEAFEVGRALGYGGATEGEAAVTNVAQYVWDKLRLGAVVVHPRAYAVAVTAAGPVKVAGPFTPQPRISTGAGDHFNAGYCLGQMIGASPEVSLQIGVGTSGYYVRNASSPSVLQLAGFLRTL